MYCRIVTADERNQAALHLPSLTPSPLHPPFPSSLCRPLSIPVAPNATASCPHADVESCGSIPPLGGQRGGSFAGRGVLDTEAAGGQQAGLQEEEAPGKEAWREEARRHARRSVDSSGAIILQLVTQVNASEPLLGEWMVNVNRPGLLANEFGPFDHVVVTTGRHNLVAFDSPEDYAAALGESTRRN